MKITALLLLAVCVVLLDSSSQVDGKLPVDIIEGKIPPEITANARYPFDPCRNKICRPGYYCVRRGWRGVCVRRPLSSICLQPLNTGHCNARQPRYFYNTYTGRCEFFMYKGCGGNSNRFYSWWQCYRRCIRRWWGPRPGPIQKLQPIAAKMFNADPDS